MKKNFRKKKILCALLTFFITLSAFSTVPALSASAQESVGNGLVLSTDSILLIDGIPVGFTALLGEGFDASRLGCIIADPNVATITPTAYAANAAAFEVTYVNSGSTVAAIYDLDNPTIVAYVAINAMPLIVEVPGRLGTNHDNYCTLVSYEFAPYDFQYADFRDYKATLKLKYQCASYEDDAYTKWGCYGYFYDIDGNVLSKVHLYCSTMAKGRVYNSEFNIPVNAVSFTIEGF